jgi:hypothetical protein
LRKLVLTLIFAAVLIGGQTAHASSNAKLMKCSSKMPVKWHLRCGQINVHKGKTALRFLRNNPKAGSKRSRSNLKRSAKYLIQYGRRHIRAAQWRGVPLPKSLSDAWAWYNRSDTQCVVNHEGGFSSVNSAGYYGRFQMDVSFQKETHFGRWAYSRWGTANNWPSWAQVVHAYDVWTRSGWSRWPTYYNYCA